MKFIKRRVHLQILFLNLEYMNTISKSLLQEMITAIQIIIRNVSKTYDVNKFKGKDFSFFLIYFHFIFHQETMTTDLLNKSSLGGLDQSNISAENTNQTIIHWKSV